MMGRFRVVIVDDHGLFREGLRAFLREDTSISRVDAVATISDGLAAVREGSPNVVVVLDISLIDEIGLDAIPAIRSQQSSYVPIITVSMHGTRSWVVDAFNAGVDGYVSKDSAGMVLRDAIEAVRKGIRYLDTTLGFDLDAIDCEIRAGTKQIRSVHERYATLSVREREVFRLYANGAKARDVAATLHISGKTVDSHRRNVLRKIGGDGVADIVRIALELGLM